MVIVFVFGGGQPPVRRIRDTLTWIALACAPLGINLARNEMIAGSFANRSIAFHPMPVFYYVKEICNTVIYFIAPDSNPVQVWPVIFIGFLETTRHTLTKYDPGVSM